MVDAGLAGGVAEGRTIAEALLPLTLALFAEPSPAVIKAVLHAQGKIPTSHVRVPLADASPATREQALAALDAVTREGERVATVGPTSALATRYLFASLTGPMCGVQMSAGEIRRSAAGDQL
jgi:hypothetical protein